MIYNETNNPYDNLYNGFWKKEGDIICYTDMFNEKECYTKETIDFCIENIKKNKDSYVDIRAYEAHLNHCIRGKSYFNN